MSAVILAIDPGARGGWCVVSPGGTRMSGDAKSAEERAGAIVHARALAALNEAPIVAVVEKWTAGGARGHAQWVGIGAARGRWLEALELGGVTRIVDVYPQRWRTLLAGLPRRTGEQAKASALLVARGLMQRECGPDEAEAVCIAAWAARSPEVAAMAAKKTRAKRATPGAVKPRAAKAPASALTSAGQQQEGGA